MTPAIFHLVTRLADTAKNYTLRNPTANATAATIMWGDASELSMPWFWIQLALLPVPAILACCLFTMVADYTVDRIAKHRHRGIEPHEVRHSISSVIPINRVAHQKKHSAGPRSQSRHRMEEERADTIARFRRQIDTSHQATVSKAAGKKPILRPTRPSAGVARPRGTMESGKVAGSQAKGTKVIGNESQGMSGGGSLTQTRAVDGKRGVGVQVRGGGVHGGRVMRGAQKDRGNGWWFDARWD